MMNILVINELFVKEWNIFDHINGSARTRAASKRLQSLSILAIERNDGTVEVLKNRYNSTKGIIPKAEFQILMKYAIGEYYYVGCTDGL